MTRFCPSVLCDRFVAYLTPFAFIFQVRDLIIWTPYLLNTLPRWVDGKAGIFCDLIQAHHSYLTPQSRVFLEKLIVKKFPAFHGTGRFITVYTRARHWSLTSTRWIQFSHKLFLWDPVFACWIIFPFRFSAIILHAFLSSSMCGTYPPWFEHHNETWWKV
jgi:hypothetical protein